MAMNTRTEFNQMWDVTSDAPLMAVLNLGVQQGEGDDGPDVDITRRRHWPPDTCEEWHSAWLLQLAAIDGR